VLVEELSALGEAADDDNNNKHNDYHDTHSDRPLHPLSAA